MAILGVDTPHGQARVRAHPVDALRARSSLVTARAGVKTPDLEAVTRGPRGGASRWSSSPIGGWATLKLVLENGAEELVVVSKLDEVVDRLGSAAHGETM